MPKWIHDRARHLQAKNPEMPESQAFAIATQQSHALGKSPEGYGTEEGRQKAKSKYDTPKDDKKTADPGGIGKSVEKKAEKLWRSGVFSTPLLEGFSDELEKIALSKEANLSGAAPTTIGKITQRVPKNTLKTPGKYSKVHVDTSESPVAKHQPVLSPPPVRG